MNIDAILQDFSDVIIARGRDYFENGRVTLLEEIAPGEFEATVEGTEDYTVTVSIADDGYVEYSCDCPYDRAPYCKHVVAVLFAIREGFAAKTVKQSSGKPAADSLSTQSLSKLPKDKLVALLQEIVREFPEVKDCLVARLAPAEDEIAAYRQLICNSIQSHMQHGFVSYAQVDGALCGIEAALKHLDEMIDTADVSHILDFSFMVLEEGMNLLECADDSDGGVGGAIGDCLSCIDELYERRIRPSDKAQKTEYFHRLISVARSPLFEKWEDWNQCLLDQCISIAEDLPDLREAIMEMYKRKLNEAAQKEDRWSCYIRDYAQTAYFELLKRWHGPERAMEYARDHMENDDFCKKIFDAYIQERQYEQALALCMEREKQTVELPGILFKWIVRRYEVYEHMNDEQSQRELGEELLMMGKVGYYQKLQRLYSADQWPHKREELLNKLEKSNKSWGVSSYLDIITQENDRPRILAYVKASPSCVFSLYKYLLPDYASDVQACFQKTIRASASRASNRNSYKAVCGQILASANACGAEFAKELIREFCRDYAHRPAFRDELHKAEEKLNRRK